jgi:hypothetical protein
MELRAARAAARRRVGAYTTTITVVGLALLAGGHPGSGQVSLPAFAAAALAFFVVNNLSVEAVRQGTGSRS